MTIEHTLTGTMYDTSALEEIKAQLQDMDEFECLPLTDNAVKVLGSNGNYRIRTEKRNAHRSGQSEENPDVFFVLPENHPLTNREFQYTLSSTSLLHSQFRCATLIHRMYLQIKRVDIPRITTLGRGCSQIT